MGTHSCIARRISKKDIQYGNIINDGYLEYVGRVLADLYNSPELVKKLFALGQLETLGAPGSEKSERMMDPDTGTFSTRIWHGYCPHERCESETEIDPKVMFTDYYYFYDSDNCWYYVKPNLVMQKIPLAYAVGRMRYFNKHPDKAPLRHSSEFGVQQEMELAYLKEMLFEYPKTDPEFKKMLEESGFDLDKEFEELSKKDFPLHRFEKEHRWLIEYFDKWSVVVVGAVDEPPVKVLLKKASEEHVETYLWEAPKSSTSE